MKLRIRSKSRLFMPASLPVVGLSLLTLAGGHAAAQDNDTLCSIEMTSVSEETPTALPLLDPQNAQPAQPPQANGRTIGKIVVVGNKTLASSAIITIAGHKIGDPCTHEVMKDMKDRLVRTGNFGM